MEGKTKWSENLLFRNDFFKNEIVQYILSLEKGHDIFIFMLKLEFDATMRVGPNTYKKETLFNSVNDKAIIYDETEEVVVKTFEILQKIGILKIYDNSYEIKRFWMGNKDRNRENKEYREWRKSVFKRDDYTCQHCGEKGGKLNAHHIKKWSECVEERFSVNNGITLCEECHKDIHFPNRNK